MEQHIMLDGSSEEKKVEADSAEQETEATVLTEEAEKQAANEPKIEERPGSRIPQPLVEAVHIGVFSVLGVLIRVLVEKSCPSQLSAFGYLFPNFLGTWVLGYWTFYAAEVQGFYGPLFVGVGTGFCGSLTTFSSWQEQAGILISPTSMFTTPGQKAYMWFLIQMGGLAVNLMGWDFGCHCTILAITQKGSSPSSGCSSTLVDVGSLLFGALILVLVVVLTVYFPTSLMFSLCWGPFGAWMRWQLGVHLNGIKKQFPIGTYVANALACGLLAMGFVLLQALGNDISVTKQNVISGFVDGFCGSLSTVSTWVKELKTLQHRKDAYIYGFSSIMTSTFLYLIIIGAYSFSSDAK